LVGKRIGGKDSTGRVLIVIIDDPPPPGPVIEIPPPPHELGGVTTGGATTVHAGTAVILAEQELLPAELLTTRVYGVIAFDGGTILIDPDEPRSTFPGLSVPVREPVIFHERTAPLPFVTLFGLIEIVQLGGTIGGTTTTTGAAVTRAVHEFVPAELLTTSVYGVIAFDGGVIVIEPDNPRSTFPGLRVPVREPVIFQVSTAPLPLVTLFGLIEIVQLGSGCGIDVPNNWSIPLILSRFQDWIFEMSEFFISPQLMIASWTSCVVALDL
jgi:hypothetical protein